ncbi:putative methyltransferase-domain-containing protein [Xylariales sp. AK1849]|nr:putative methyltransferase-domain-containing protein [Xylariales sp. AK1849]
MATAASGFGSAEASISRFCCQYLQGEREIDFPTGDLLREEHVQAALYRRLFPRGGQSPPSRYELRVLKELTSRIESSIEDWDQHGISDDLMGRLSELLVSPLPSEADAMQQKTFITYSLSLLQCSSESLTQCPQITLLESRNLISAAGTTGLRTWEAALHLGQYLCTNPSLVQDKGVLELGAGTGYISILCAKLLGARQVIASDGSDDVVANLPENFFVSGLQGSDVISAMDLKWGYALVGGEEPAWNGGKPIDIVLGADVTYDESVLPSLAGIMGELYDLFPMVKVIIAATQRNRKTFEAFLRVCKQRRFAVREIAYDLPPREKQTGPFYSDKVPIRICEIQAG